MFNLMMTGASDAWEEGQFVWPTSRILEYTDDLIRDRFRALTPENLTELAALPTLFMYETGSAGRPRVGHVTHLQRRGGEVRVIYEFDETLPELDNEALLALTWPLQLRDWEQNRTHWAVKDGDLYAILREANLIPQQAEPELPQVEEEPEPAQQATVTVAPSRVFLVHGRDGGRMNQVARFLETKVGLEVCILSEQPNRGRTIISKFEEEARGASYAVVLMTADDTGALKPELNNGAAGDQEARARQNVILELGFFLGKLGLDRVCVLLSPGVVKPSDYDGVVWIPFDEQEGWQRKLVNELHAAEVPVSADWWQ